MQVITYQSPAGETIDLSPAQEAEFDAMGTWPKDATGQEFCSVSRGQHEGEPSPLYMVTDAPGYYGFRGPMLYGRYPTIAEAFRAAGKIHHRCVRRGVSVRKPGEYLNQATVDALFPIINYKGELV